MDCIRTELNIIEKHSTKSNICILAHYEDYRSLLFDKKELDINIPIYCLLNNRLDFNLELKNVPYYFMLNSDLQATCFCVPAKEHPQKTIAYFNSLGVSKN